MDISFDLDLIKKAETKCRSVNNLHESLVAKDEQIQLLVEEKNKHLNIIMMYREFTTDLYNPKKNKKPRTVSYNPYVISKPECKKDYNELTVGQYIFHMIEKCFLATNDNTITIQNVMEMGGVNVFKSSSQPELYLTQQSVEKFLFHERQLVDSEGKHPLFYVYPNKDVWVISKIIQ